MSFMNSTYRAPNFNVVRRFAQGALAALTFSDGVSIDVRPCTAKGPRPALRVTFKGDIYKPNYNRRVGPIKDVPFYDIILETMKIEQGSADAARPEDIQKIVTALEPKAVAARHWARSHGGTRRTRRTRRRQTKKAKNMRRQRGGA
jgi:hypothetical protein